MTVHMINAHIRCW